jgi:hypothetical protein
MKTFTKNKHYMFLVSIPYNAKSLSMWDEMDSSSEWMIQAKTYGSFIFCILNMVCVMSGRCT